MSPQAVTLDLFIDGVWTAVPLYSAAGSVVTRGMDPGGTWPAPSSITTEINNDSLNYDPSRPESPLYGKAGRNTRARMRINGTTRLWAEASVWRPERTVEHVSGA